ncbi:MAG: glycosyltransferase family 4 protein [Nanoarchaeota archaeon]|nr:glycosyltransferase family 4 protein [Nanoarchaeota archaeon]MBU1854691.1 glycosyltransferase family 4 protein [Nanoarchaeota archaeon]
MKLIIASDNYLPRWDGIARFLSEITPILAKNFEITLIVPNFGETKEKDLKIEKIPVKKISLGDFQPAKIQYARIRSIIKEADAVFTQTIGPIGICSIIAAKRLSKPLISFIHSIEWELFPKAVSSPIAKKILYPLSKKFVRFLYNKSNLLIVPASNIADMLGWQNISTRKKVVHLGVNTDKFQKENKEQAKKKLKLDPKELIIGYHGRLGREKDLKTLLRAFLRIRKENQQIKLMIVGSGARDVEKLFKNKEGIIFPGPQNKVIPWIQAMDIYVLPSLTETSSLSTLEAMSCEIPVIATKVGFVKDYLEDGINGLFFRQKNPFDLYKKIKMLINDPKLREKLGTNARKKIIEEFQWNITAERIEKAINELVEKEN